MTAPAAPPHSARPASVPRWTRRPRRVRVRQLPRRMGLAYHRDCKAARSTWKGLRVQRHPLHVEHCQCQWQCRWAERWSPIQLHEFTLNGASQRGNRASGVTPPWKRAEVCCAPGAAELYAWNSSPLPGTKLTTKAGRMHDVSPMISCTARDAPTGVMGVHTAAPAVRVRRRGERQGLPDGPSERPEPALAAVRGASTCGGATEQGMRRGKKGGPCRSLPRAPGERRAAARRPRWARSARRAPRAAAGRPQRRSCTASLPADGLSSAARLALPAHWHGWLALPTSLAASACVRRHARAIRMRVPPGRWGAAGAGAGAVDRSSA